MLKLPRIIGRAALATASVLALSGMGHAALPPASLTSVELTLPANVWPNPDFAPACSTGSTPQCLAQELQATDNARFMEGVGPIALPSNYDSLTPAEQVFVVINLERIGRGLAPIPGTTADFNSAAYAGAAASTDPMPTNADGFTSNWAGSNGYLDALMASYFWMYVDGPGGYNLDCTPGYTSGCWGHREDELTSAFSGYAPPAGYVLAMGTAYDPTNNGITMVIGFAPSQPYVFTWAAEAALIPASSPQGDAPWLGSIGTSTLNKPIVGMAATPDGKGYWMVATDGGIFSFGDAKFYGSMGGTTLNKPIVGMAVDPATGGYWMVASDGGIFSFNAPFYGSMGGKPLNQPIVGIAATPDGKGYWLVAKDGGIFSFGDAPFYGSMGGKPLNQPIVGMAVDPATGGYWMVASDGGIFSFNAPFYGSMGGVTLDEPVVGMAATPDGKGYWMVATDGGIFSFGDAGFYGSMGGVTLDEPVVGIASTPDGKGYWMAGSSGLVFAL
ncbi:MAG: hypothetical protein M0Z92_00890 [Actinomycetota bacterium]|nr:hypothetical protein [Actinomycetota bacterium]